MLQRYVSRRRRSWEQIYALQRCWVELNVSGDGEWKVPRGVSGNRTAQLIVVL